MIDYYQNIFPNLKLNNKYDMQSVLVFFLFNLNLPIEINFLKFFNLVNLMQKYHLNIHRVHLYLHE